MDSINQFAGVGHFEMLTLLYTVNIEFFCTGLFNLNENCFQLKDVSFSKSNLQWVESLHVLVQFYA